MNVLFVHQNFPAQFKHLAMALAEGRRNRVVALHVNPTRPISGVEMVAVHSSLEVSVGMHRWVADFDSKVARGEATYNAAEKLKRAGFTPDFIMAHPGWGESLFLRELWPNAPMALYCEYYYNAIGTDVNFDPEFGHDTDAGCRLRIKNAVQDLQLPHMTAGLSPTRWQRATYPKIMRESISVIHDGIDTSHLVPDRNIGLNLNRNGQKVTIAPGEEVITYIARNLEPYRGFHSLMRSLPEIMRRRPKAQILIVGGDGVSYGPSPSQNGSQSPRSWKQTFLDEVRDKLDLSRIHFFGRVPYHQYRAILQISTVHVYLTYPFVLSWSLLEAMSTGCAIVASDTAPVREVIRHAETGLLVNFFDSTALADMVCSLCDDKATRRRLGNAARAYTIENYDLRNVCLPAQKVWVNSLLN